MNLISVILNGLIVLLTALGLFLMMTGMGHDRTLAQKSWKAFRYFTVDSNVFMGLVAAVCLIAGWNSKSRGAELPMWCLVLLMTGTVAVAVTLVTVVVFLAPTCKKGYLAMFTGSNFLFHLLIPLLAVADFIITARGRAVPFYAVPVSLSTVVVYGIAYIINVFRHTENGQVSEKYDWYGFVAGGIKYTGLATAVMLCGTFLIACLLWRVTR